jgi:hypothetical protein
MLAGNEPKNTDMPTISEFFGILIRMYWDDHPPPHFHAIYGEHEAQYNIATLDVIHGKLPRRAHALVVEWASLHKDELMKNWERCQVPAPAVPIDPLPMAPPDSPTSPRVYLRVFSVTGSTRFAMRRYSQRHTSSTAR